MCGKGLSSYPVFTRNSSNWHRHIPPYGNMLIKIQIKKKKNRAIKVSLRFFLNEKIVTIFKVSDMTVNKRTKPKKQNNWTSTHLNHVVLQSHLRKLYSYSNSAISQHFNVLFDIFFKGGS